MTGEMRICSQRRRDAYDRQIHNNALIVFLFLCVFFLVFNSDRRTTTVTH